MKRREATVILNKWLGLPNGNDDFTLAQIESAVRTATPKLEKGKLLGGNRLVLSAVDKVSIKIVKAADIQPTPKPQAPKPLPSFVERGTGRIPTRQDLTHQTFASWS